MTGIEGDAIAARQPSPKPGHSITGAFHAGVIIDGPRGVDYRDASGTDAKETSTTSKIDIELGDETRKRLLDQI